MDKNQNHIEEVFREAFANHESEVGSHVWANVQAGITAQAGVAASGAAGISSIIKAAAVVGLSAITIVGTVNEIALNSSSTQVSIEAVEISPAADQIEADTPEQVETVSVVIPESAEVEERLSEPNENVTPPQSTNDNADVVSRIDEAQVDDAGQHVGDVLIPHAEHSNASAAVKAEPMDRKIETEPSEHSETESKTPETFAEETADIEPLEEEETPSPRVRLKHDAKAFISADGDGTNDCFTTSGGENLQSFSIKIYTQAGELVFESGDVGFSWCGTDKYGKLLENRSTCFYLIQAIDKNGELYNERNAKGSIQIFR